MKDSMIINAPNLPKPTSTANFVFSLVIIILFGVGFCCVLLLPSGVVPIYITVACVVFGGLILSLLFYALALRAKATKRRVILSKEGIFIQYDNYSQHIDWQNVSKMTLVIVVRSYETAPKEADPFFFFTTNSIIKQPPEILISYRNKNQYFIAYPEEFTKFLGPNPPFSFAINARNGSEVDPLPFFATCGITLEVAPPIMEVQTATEYNQLVKEMYIEELGKKYQPPDDTSNQN